MLGGCDKLQRIEGRMKGERGAVECRRSGREWGA